MASGTQPLSSGDEPSWSTCRARYPLELYQGLCHRVGEGAVAAASVHLGAKMGRDDERSYRLSYDNDSPSSPFVQSFQGIVQTFNFPIWVRPMSGNAKKREASYASRFSVLPVMAKVALHLRLIYCSSWIPSTLTLLLAGRVMLSTVRLLLTGRVYPKT